LILYNAFHLWYDDVTMMVTGDYTTREVYDSAGSTAEERRVGGSMHSLRVDILLRLPLGLLGAPLGLLGGIASDRSSHILGFPSDAIAGSLDVAFGLRSLDLAFASCVLLLAARLPRSRAGQVADTFDDCAFNRVVLTGGLVGSV